MSCQYNLLCKFQDTSKCDTCFTEGLFFQPIPEKKQKKQTVKKDKRQGSFFEHKNHLRNEAIIQETTSNLTINSGATRKEKGDENIRGYIKVSEELKTQMPDRVKGTKSFTIQRSWLDKLHFESKQKEQEFWYLVFSFAETGDTGPAGDTFVVAEKDMIFNMVTNMIEDRKRADLAALELQTAEKKVLLKEAEISKLHRELDYLNSKLKLLEVKYGTSTTEEPNGSGCNKSSSKKGKEISLEDSKQNNRS